MFDGSQVAHMQSNYVVMNCTVKLNDHKVCWSTMHCRSTCHCSSILDYANATETRGKSDSTDLLSGNVSATSQRLLVPDNDAVSGLVTGRLDSPRYRRLLLENFALDTIKDCLENQLRLKRRIQKLYEIPNTISFI